MGVKSPGFYNLEHGLILRKLSFLFVKQVGLFPVVAACWATLLTHTVTPPATPVCPCVLPPGSCRYWASWRAGADRWACPSGRQRQPALAI